MKRILPIFKTPISTYPHTANLAAILWGNEQIYPWLQNCFVKVYGWHVENEDYSMDYEDFYILDCPAILCERLNSKLISQGWGSPLEFIRDAIDSSYYVYTIVDTSKIKQYTSGGIGLHDLFIYGYDDSIETLYTSDCFRGGKYSNAKIPFIEFMSAYPYELEYFENIFEFHNDIMLIKPNEEFSLSFCQKRFKESISDFLEAIPSRYTYSRLKLQCRDEQNALIEIKNLAVSP